MGMTELDLPLPLFPIYQEGSPKGCQQIERQASEYTCDAFQHRANQSTVMEAIPKWMKTVNKHSHLDDFVHLPSDLVQGN